MSLPAEAMGEVSAWLVLELQKEGRYRSRLTGKSAAASRQNGGGKEAARIRQRNQAHPRIGITATSEQPALTTFRAFVKIWRERRGGTARPPSGQRVPAEEDQGVRVPAGHGSAARSSGTSY